MTKRVAWFTGEPSVKECFTPYKVYDVFNEDGDSFNLKDDTGDTRFCCKQGCAHICHGNWVFADVEEDVIVNEQTVAKPKKAKKWSKWRKHTTGNVPKELDKNDIVKVKLRNLPKGVPFTVGTGCWVECGDYTIMEYKVKLNGKEKPKSKWTKNKGVCPVDSDIEVEFKRRDGDKYKDEAGECDWQLQGQDYDIIKWRLAD